MNQTVLVGKTITAIHLADDKMAIKFDIDGGDPIIARCDADCCSHTWVENIENAEAAVGAPVVVATNIPMPDLGQPNEYDCIAYYGFKIETAKGTCVIDYRNESNGYYGGGLSWPGDSYFYGGVYNQNISKEEWNRIA